ncbi:alpha/beta hydrolase [uncultured Polaribacter sp.]|uniref:alpha/beta hydrolase n=1 Tax=uncultured Polaribacter sp. TaxID=174711 RepID=UPI00260C86A1|nr:alpha/beta hydrolase [uncultured Polaribacter sp.]
MEIINYKCESNGLLRFILHAFFRKITNKSYRLTKKGNYQKSRKLMDKFGFSNVKNITYKKTTLSNFNALLITPQKELNPKRIILFFHGGGFVLGSCKSHKSLVANIVKTSKTKAILFDYRLAPEHKFPAQIDDAKNTYFTLIEEGYLPENIIIMGDSAGGNMTLNFLLYLKNKQKPFPNKAVCLFPVCDPASTKDSLIRNNKKDSFLSGEFKNLFSDLTFKNVEDQKKYNLLNQNLENLPPILVQIGTYDVLYDENIELINVLKKAKNTGKAEIWDKMTHGWHGFKGILKESQMAINNIHQFINN